MRRLLQDLFAAFGLLTRLPMPRPDEGHPPDIRRSVWAFPVVGAVIGALSALAWFGGQFAGLGLSLSAGLALGVQLLVTGALHEDGLADFADGIGGGRGDKERSLAIMRDSRIGTYGVVVLVLVIGLRWSAMASLGLHMVLAGLICSAMIGRLMLVLLPILLNPARSDGLGLLVANPPRGALVAAIVITLAIVFLHLPAAVAIASFLVAGAAAGWVALLAKRAIGGYTGDVLGAACLSAETAVLLVFASV